jgi:DNA-binding XRE family transcriptional regulator
MIIKTWQFENSKQEIPSWLKNNCEKRINSPRLWVYTQYGEIPANEGHWISLNLRGHVDVHKTKPMKTNIIQEMGASFLFVAMAILVLVSSAGNVMEDFNVKITVRNNRLLQAILKKYKSVADLARKMNRSQSRVNALVTMKAKPITEKGWTQLAFDVAAMVGKEPKKLWPEHLQNIKLLTSTSEFTIDIEGVKQIMSDNSVEKMIAQSQVLRQLDTRLNNTQKKVIDMRFYQEMTLEETGKVLGLSRERIRQIECKSLRMMRYDARTQGYLKPRSKNNKNLLAKLEKTNQGCELFE